MGVSVGSSIYKAPSIYESGAGGGGGGGGSVIPLPEGYEPIESVHLARTSNEGVYLDFMSPSYLSSFNTNENRFYIECHLNTIYQNDMLLYAGGFSKSITILFSNNVVLGDFIQFRNGTNDNYFYSSDAFTKYANQDVNISINKSAIKINDDVYNVAFESGSINYFTVTTKTVGNTGAEMELKKLYIYSPSDMLVFFGIPAKRILDDKEGIFDLITSSFYPV